MNSFKSLSETFILVTAVGFTAVNVPVIKCAEIYIHFAFVIKKNLGKQQRNQGEKLRRGGVKVLFLVRCTQQGVTKCIERYLRGRACPVARIFHKSYYNQYFD
jgi:hypothetical protein